MSYLSIITANSIAASDLELFLGAAEGEPSLIKILATASKNGKYGGSLRGTAVKVLTTLLLSSVFVKHIFKQK